MIGNGTVFISHAHADNERCQPLLAALDAWGVDYWFDTERMKAGDALARRIQNAITERDIFIRVCTVAAQTSYWMDLEEDAFRALQAEDQRQGKSGKRVLITIVLDTQYQLTPFERAAIFIDAARHSRQEWLRELQRAIGVADAPIPATMPVAAPRASQQATADITLNAPSIPTPPTPASAPSVTSTAAYIPGSYPPLASESLGYGPPPPPPPLRGEIDVTYQLFRFAAMIVGLVGAIVVLALNPIFHGSTVGYIVAGVAFVGAISTFFVPALGGLLLLIAGVGFFIVDHVGLLGVLFGTPTLILAAILAFLCWRAKGRAA